MIEIDMDNEYKHLGKVHSVLSADTIRTSEVTICFVHSTDESDTMTTSLFPKCHPYVAGCVVVVLFLFSIYHAKDINKFVNSLFYPNFNKTD